MIRPGISPAMLAQAGVRLVNADEARALVGYSQPGLLVPYVTRNGQSVKIDGKPFARLRLTNPTSSAKYLSPAGAGCQLYEPPGLRALLVPGCVLGVVEGEFKALALVEGGFAAVGIGGISSACPKNDADEPQLLPALAGLIAEVRPAKLLFIGDADTALIPDFAREAVKLAQLAGVPVALPRIPLDAPGKGPDDLCEILGTDFAARWQTILDTSEAITAETKPPALAVRLLRRESDAFTKLDPDALDKARARLVKLGAAYRDDALAFNEIVSFVATVAGLNKQTFRSAVSEEAKRQSAAARVANEEATLRAFAKSSEANPLFFDGKAYWRKEADGSFGQLYREDARLHLRMAGFSEYAPDGEASPADRALHLIQVQGRVNYAGPICGRPPGLHRENGLQILVTRGPAFIEPKAGDCPTITGLLANLLGRAAGDKLAYTQAAVFIGWLKLARLAVLNFAEHRPGQVLALVGPPDCSKSLLQSSVITPALGGRVADPSLWATGGTTFNSELWGAEHLAIGDKSLGDDGRERARLRDELKRMTASPDYPLHGKHREALTLRQVWRVTLSANDDPESAASLPALDASFADKITYLQCYAPPAPFFDADDLDAKARFASTLRGELPAFLASVDAFDIPPELVKGRFGIREFHHPAILDLLQSSSPLVPLADTLESWINTWDAGTAQMELPSIELYAVLDEHLHNRLRPTSSGPKHLGHQLARLATLTGWQGRINRKERRIGGRTQNQRQTVWEIRREAVA